MFDQNGILCAGNIEYLIDVRRDTLACERLRHEKEQEYGNLAHWKRCWSLGLNIVVRGYKQRSLLVWLVSVSHG